MLLLSLFLSWFDPWLPPPNSDLLFQTRRYRKSFLFRLSFSSLLPSFALIRRNRNTLLRFWHYDCIPFTALFTLHLTSCTCLRLDPYHILQSNDLERPYDRQFVHLSIVVSDFVCKVCARHKSILLDHLRSVASSYSVGMCDMVHMRYCFHVCPYILRGLSTHHLKLQRFLCSTPSRMDEAVKLIPALAQQMPMIIMNVMNTSISSG
ncbi:hypothetical protein BC939DRAFT_468304 [Gamsiella multidivaricata]|uniref:uncharacterized protein n=1 Tax=Gamsiella multidivaricata TaxID=101098 RepID=UPI00221F4161|nr:uncharacterized protein BC939DRAFT_468304 [Gamsiella multidivaricata]KAI7816658.1 hypothetical protein BC939DRAFT_468304 [Gamsiella multidivaricata]